MKKFCGPKKIKTAVFISGTGSNLKNLLKFSFKKKSPIQIIFVVSSNRNAKGLKLSKKYNILSKIFNFTNKHKDENQILKFLRKKDITLICLAGFMKILSKKFIKKFNGNILNIHPSLLPKYKGLNTHERAIRNKEKMSGCTVHFVSPKLDSGKIILQKKVKINKNDTPKKLSQKVLKQEHILYPRAIKKIFASL
tara:strand:- start:42 stop:626 length:585 start_codon:yes stop_codon:yes gene_type:complete